MKSMKSMKSMNAMKIFPFGAPLWILNRIKPRLLAAAMMLAENLFPNCVAGSCLFLNVPAKARLSPCSRAIPGPDARRASG
jgi:hypothetical protein